MRERLTREPIAAYAPQLLALPGCGALIAGRIIGEIAGVERFRSDAQLARLAASLRSTPPPANSGGTGSTDTATAA